MCVHAFMWYTYVDRISRNLDIKNMQWIITTGQKKSIIYAGSGERGGENRRQDCWVVEGP